MTEKYIPSYVKNKQPAAPGDSSASKALEAELAAVMGASKPGPAQVQARPGTMGMQRQGPTLMDKILSFFSIG